MTTRRGFLEDLLWLGSDITFNNGKATSSVLEMLAAGKAEAAQQKNMEYLTQEDAIYDINRALQKVKGGRSQKGYEDAFAHFASIYSKSMAKFEQTKDQFFLKTAVAGAMYAGRSMMDASSLGNGKKKENLDMALSIYGEALVARQKLGKGKHSVYKRNLIDLPVADEKLIRKRVSETYEALIQVTSDREMTNYLRSLIETYKRLVELTGGTERLEYQSRIHVLSPKLDKR